jgi:Tol biopolymer transport system component
MNTGETTLVSLDSNGAQIGGGAFYEGPAISGDGRYVAFESGGNIYVRDRQTNITIIASVASDGTVANDVSDQPVISSDIAFASAATNLIPGDTNGWMDVFAAPNPLAP